MIYTVVWVPSAQADLATLWMNAADRAAVSAASNAIDTALRNDPFQNSESRSGSSRVMFVPPLAVAYDVSEADCLVTVWAVWCPA